MKADYYLKHGKFYIWKEKFAVLKSKKPFQEAFANISIFVISAFSTDHILVKEKDIERAISKLKALGLKEASEL